MSIFPKGLSIYARNQCTGMTTEVMVNEKEEGKGRDMSFVCVSMFVYAWVLVNARLQVVPARGGGESFQAYRGL